MIPRAVLSHHLVQILPGAGRFTLGGGQAADRFAPVQDFVPTLRRTIGDAFPEPVPAGIPLAIRS